MCVGICGLVGLLELYFGVAELGAYKSVKGGGFLLFALLFLLFPASPSFFFLFLLSTYTKWPTLSVLKLILLVI